MKKQLKLSVFIVSSTLALFCQESDAIKDPFEALNIELQEISNEGGSSNQQTIQSDATLQKPKNSITFPIWGLILAGILTKYYFLNKELSGLKKTSAQSASKTNECDKCSSHQREVDQITKNLKSHLPSLIKWLEKHHEGKDLNEDEWTKTQWIKLLYFKENERQDELTAQSGLAVITKYCQVKFKFELEHFGLEDTPEQRKKIFTKIASTILRIFSTKDICSASAELIAELYNLPKKEKSSNLLVEETVLKRETEFIFKEIKQEMARQESSPDETKKIRISLSTFKNRCTRKIKDYTKSTSDDSNSAKIGKEIILGLEEVNPEIECDFKEDPFDKSVLLLNQMSALVRQAIETKYSEEKNLCDKSLREFIQEQKIIQARTRELNKQHAIKTERAINDRNVTS